MKSFLAAVAALVVGAMALLVLKEPWVAGQRRDTPVSVEASVLLYHRFGSAVSNEMTVRTGTFRSQLDYLKEHGYPIVPLRTLVAYLVGAGPAPPARAVAITVDDGHASV